MKKITVNTAKEYDVYIASDLLREVGALVRNACGGEKAIIVSDENVYKLYGAKVVKALENNNYQVESFVFSAGEKSKSWETLGGILKRLTEKQLSRTDIVVALGGGVVGDVAGLASALYLRGIRWAQIPTTLLSMVDSAVGGKTAIDFHGAKNNIGAFYQPDIVCCDVATLKTLEPEIYQEGWAEIIKHGIIQDVDLFEMILDKDICNLEAIIARNVEIKANIVEKDEKESNQRRLLNFGHTLGHAIERLSDYTISHGQAVACGMALETRGVWRLDYCSGECYQKVVEAVTAFGFKTTTDFTAEQLIAVAYDDKKRKGQKIALVFPEKIGKAIIKELTLDEFADFVKLALNQK